MLHQPDPEKKPDLLQGLITIRQMFLKIMEDTKLPIADEMLYPENARYFSDCIHTLQLVPVQLKTSSIVLHQVV